jgi:hypothetical protein
MWSIDWASFMSGHRALVPWPEYELEMVTKLRTAVAKKDLGILSFFFNKSQT